MRGLGKQLKASIITIVCYYAFGLPLALFFAFGRDYELVGLWGGMLIAAIIYDCCMLVLVINGPWTKAEAEFQAKIAKTGSSNTSKPEIYQRLMDGYDDKH